MGHVDDGDGGGDAEEEGTSASAVNAEEDNEDDWERVDEVVLHKEAAWIG